MEILLIACMLAWTAGAQSEQSKLGLSPAQRDILRERARHEKAVQKIADRHGVAPPATPTPGVSPRKETPAADPVMTLPEAFRSGYRSHTPIERVATPLGRRAGLWTAQGVAWAKDTGRGAVREYRRRRRASGHSDPAPVLVPLPPAHPPAVPKMPDKPPTAGTGGGKGVVLTKPEEGGEAAGPDGPEKPPEPPAEPRTGGDGPTDAPEPSTGPEKAADEPAPVYPSDAEARRQQEVLERLGLIVPEPRQAEPVDRSPSESSTEPPVMPVTEPVTPPSPPVTEPAAAVTAPTTEKEPAPAGAGGIGRMAAEVNYDSVMEESDELSLMCDEDVQVYGRIRTRCEREIGRGDALIAALESVGAGVRVIAWVTRCKDQYGAIHGQLDDLQQNTLAQGEAVVKAKALLEAGQGLYAGIAQDMESVADREFYVSDVVDSEDAAAHTETYETKGA
ncbi:hypothetical protein [Streptomyces sp. NPDC002550]